jgi:hypothetical protein
MAIPTDEMPGLDGESIDDDGPIILDPKIKVKTEPTTEDSMMFLSSVFGISNSIPDLEEAPVKVESKKTQTNSPKKRIRQAPEPARAKDTNGVDQDQPSLEQDARKMQLQTQINEGLNKRIMSAERIKSLNEAGLGFTKIGKGKNASYKGPTITPGQYKGNF